MRTIITIIYLFFFFIFSVPYLGIQYLIGKNNKEKAAKAQLRLVQSTFKFIMFLSGVKLTVIGEENVPKDEPVLYIGNHRGFFDTVITYSRCPGLTGYIAKNSIEEVPILRIWMRRLNCLFINRDDIKQSLSIILDAIEKVKNGISICIFPEGTRMKDTTDSAAMLPFKEGSFKIATKSGCKIIPMAITGTDNILENHFPWLKSTRVILQYGEPIDPKTLSKEEAKKIGAYTQEVVQQMLIEHKKML